jgi:hypothetical protein
VIGIGCQIYAMLFGWKKWLESHFSWLDVDHLHRMLLLSARTPIYILMVIILEFMMLLFGCQGGFLRFDLMWSIPPSLLSTIISSCGFYGGNQFLIIHKSSHLEY